MPFFSLCEWARALHCIGPCDSVFVCSERVLRSLNTGRIIAIFQANLSFQN